jgi:hypothetical protein
MVKKRRLSTFQYVLPRSETSELRRQPWPPARHQLRELDAARLVEMNRLTDEVCQGDT